jgi:hypothetical protein
MRPPKSPRSDNVNSLLAEINLPTSRFDNVLKALRPPTGRGSDKDDTLDGPCNLDPPTPTNKNNQTTVIGHCLMLLLSIAKRRDLLNSQLPVYVGDRQAPPDLLNLLPEGTDLDPDVWLTHHKSIPAFPRRNSKPKIFWIQKILLEEFVDTYQIQQIQNSHVLAYCLVWSKKCR